MGRAALLVVLAVTFFVGWAVGSVGRKPASPATSNPDQQATIARLRQQVETLQARLRTREETGTVRAPSLSPTERAAMAAMAQDPASGINAARGDQPAGGATTDPSKPSAKGQATAPATVQAALDRFYKYLEATAPGAGREGWRQARDMLQQLKAMGAPAGQALMQVLAAGTDTDERRAAARLLGQLQVANAVPLLRDVIDRDDDVLLRRAAASGLRQLQTPESIPVMERLLAQPAEDRFVRLSAAVGLAESGRSHGVMGLMHIFDESTADGRGRDMAFRALSNLKDDRPLPFMRQVATSQAEPGYRVQAIRYLSAHGDQQALVTLHTLMNSPTEQPSIRDAAAQAHAVISARK